MESFKDYCKNYILDNIGDLCTVDTVIKPEYNFKAS